MMMIIFAGLQIIAQRLGTAQPPPDAFSLICNTNHVREGHFSYALGQYQTSCSVIVKSESTLIFLTRVEITIEIGGRFAHT